MYLSMRNWLGLKNWTFYHKSFFPIKSLSPDQMFDGPQRAFDIHIPYWSWQTRHPSLEGCWTKQPFKKMYLCTKITNALGLLRLCCIGGWYPLKQNNIMTIGDVKCIAEMKNNMWINISFLLDEFLWMKWASNINIIQASKQIKITFIKISLRILTKISGTVSSSFRYLITNLKESSSIS